MDVFFVVSGYLISGIIIRAIERGTFTLRDFYARRINRIFPALIVTLLATLSLGWYLLFPSEFASLGKHIAAGAIFLSNAVLVQETGYFDVAAEKKPLLHLWSLAIEEQFYLFWPLLLAVSWRFRKRFAFPALAIGISSFFLAIAAANTDHRIGAFYLPFTRLWELVAGFSVFYMEMQNREGRSSRSSDAMAIAGLAMVCVSLLVIDNSVAWPGVWTLVPVGGTCLLIASGRDCWINRRVLSNRALVGIGLISYPLYLWHWPLLSFVRFIQPKDTSVLLLSGAVAVSFVLALLTFRLVEFPIRSRTNGRGRRALVLVGVLAALGILGASAERGRIQVRIDSPQVRSVQNALGDWRFPGGGFEGEKLVENIIQGQRGDTVLFGGDSHMEQYWPRVDTLIRFSGRPMPTAIFATVRACPMFPGVGRKDVRECDRAYSSIMQRAMSPGVGTVVITSYWDDFFRRSLIFREGDRAMTPLRLDQAGTDSVFANFERDLKELVIARKQVFVVLTVPIGAHDEFDPRSWLPDRLEPSRTVKVVPQISRAEYVARSEPVLRRVRASSIRAGATVLDPIPYMCSTDTCPTVDSVGNPLYVDSRHLRFTVARRRAAWMDATLR